MKNIEHIESCCMVYDRKPLEPHFARRGLIPIMFLLLGLLLTASCAFEMPLEKLKPDQPVLIRGQVDDAVNVEWLGKGGTASDKPQGRVTIQSGTHAVVVDDLIDRDLDDMVNWRAVLVELLEGQHVGDRILVPRRNLFTTGDP